MRAQWSTNTNKLVVVGKHKGGAPRLWTVTLWAVIPMDDGASETVTWLIRPREPIRLTDLGDLIVAELDKHPGKTAAGWTAIAR